MRYVIHALPTCGKSWLYKQGGLHGVQFFDPEDHPAFAENTVLAVLKAKQPWKKNYAGWEQDAKDRNAGYKEVVDRYAPPDAVIISNMANSNSFCQQVGLMRLLSFGVSSETMYRRTRQRAKDPDSAKLPSMDTINSWVGGWATANHIECPKIQLSADEYLGRYVPVVKIALRVAMNDISNIGLDARPSPAVNESLHETADWLTQVKLSPHVPWAMEKTFFDPTP